MASGVEVAQAVRSPSCDWIWVALVEPALAPRPRIDALAPSSALLPVATANAPIVAARTKWVAWAHSPVSSSRRATFLADERLPIMLICATSAVSRPNEPPRSVNHDNPDTGRLAATSSLVASSIFLSRRVVPMYAYEPGSAQVGTSCALVQS